MPPGLPETRANSNRAVGGAPLRLVAGCSESGSEAPAPPVRTFHRLSEARKALAFFLERMVLD